MTTLSRRIPVCRLYRFFDKTGVALKNKVLGRFPSSKFLSNLGYPLVNLSRNRGNYSFFFKSLNHQFSLPQHATFGLSLDYSLPLLIVEQLRNCSSTTHSIIDYDYSKLKWANRDLVNTNSFKYGFNLQTRQIFMNYKLTLMPLITRYFNDFFFTSSRAKYTTCLANYDILLPKLGTSRVVLDYLTP